MNNYYEDEDFEADAGLFGDRVANVKEYPYSSHKDDDNRDKDKYNEEGNLVGWEKTRERW